MINFSFARNVAVQKLSEQLTKDRLLTMIYHEYVIKGKVMLAFRNNEATFYYHGKQLCNVKENNSFIPTINQAFLPLRSLIGEKGHYLNETEWRSRAKLDDLIGYADVLPEILEAMEYKQDPESLQVSNLYKFSPLCAECNSDIILLDIEATFVSHDVADRNRIDVVLYHTKERQLIFTEVKRLSDVRLQRSGKLSDEICNQMNDYKNIIASSKGQLINEYNKVIEYYASLSAQAISSIDSNKDILLGLWITEHKRQDAEVIKNITEEVDARFPVANIGQMSSLKAESLEKVYQIFSRSV